MDSAELQPIKVYIKWRQTTIAERVYFRPVYALCIELDRISETSLLVHWWDQDAVNDPEE